MIVYLKNNTMKFIKIIFFALLIISFTACKKTNTPKNTGCVDEALKELSKNIFCTQDCPGIVGCDDKIYCNECEAAKQGIRKK